MAAALENASVILARDPHGRRVEAQDLQVTAQPFAIPETLEPGALVLRNLYLSLDPYMRGRMNTRVQSYFPAFKLGEAIETFGVAEVIAGQRGSITVGDTVAAYGPFAKYTVLAPAQDAYKVDTSAAFSPSLMIGLFGLTGATAYYGLSICDPKPGQTIFVSGAAGAVGLSVGQLAKAKGLTVIGSAGSDEKVRLLVEEFGFDAAFNYRNLQGQIQEKLQELAPEGLDSYFDNVGSEHLDAALGCMKRKGVVSACGMIATYNGETFAYRNLPCIVFKELKVQGFIILDNMKDPEFMARFQADVAELLAAGKVSSPEHIVDGIEKTPEAFVGLFDGVNIGKLVVKV